MLMASDACVVLHSKKTVFKLKAEENHVDGKLNKHTAQCLKKPKLLLH
jgi:hypothetical protein